MENINFRWGFILRSSLDTQSLIFTDGSKEKFDCIGNCLRDIVEKSCTEEELFPVIPCLVVVECGELVKDMYWKNLKCRRMEIFSTFDMALERGRAAVMANDEEWFDSPELCLKDFEEQRNKQIDVIDALTYIILIFKDIELSYRFNLKE